MFFWLCLRVWLDGRLRLFVFLRRGSLCGRFGFFFPFVRGLGFRKWGFFPVRCGFAFLQLALAP